MRIIAGKHRGLRLASFQGQDVRPTPDRVKESLFQILSEMLPGARVLDLFAGSGALGLECLSRGASEVIFNDSSKESLALVKKNLAAAREEGKLYNLDYTACLKTVAGQFDLILCDPPYQSEEAETVFRLVAERNLLGAGGILVYESEREVLPPPGWERTDFRKYGRVKLYFFQRSLS